MTTVLNENIDNIIKINDLYKNLSYTDLYGGSVLFFAILVIFFLLVMAYFNVMKLREPIKADWINQRCNLKVLPFAGQINKPDNMTAWEFTNQNFQYCIQNSVQSMVGAFTQDVTASANLLKDLSTGLTQDINSSRTMFNNIRNNLASITNTTMSSFSNMMIPIQQIIITFNDIMAKVKGTLTAALYTFFGAYLGLETLFGAILQIAKEILISLAILIAFLWAMSVFYAPMASAAGIMTALYSLIALLLGTIIVFSKKHMPGVAKCFDKDTLLEMNDGTFKPISSLSVGDVLKNKNTITAFIKVAAEGSKMYRLEGNIIVSDTHKIICRGKLIDVCKHPEAKPVLEPYKEPYLYCLNTTTKRINIGKYIFSDWDDLSDKIIEQNGYKGKTEQIHVSEGFIPNSVLEKINIGDILPEKVYGIVKILVSSEGQYKDNLGNIVELDTDNRGYLVHFLTHEGRISLGGKEYLDYNSCIEKKIIF